mgnify:CR=1 FL=1
MLTAGTTYVFRMQSAELQTPYLKLMNSSSQLESDAQSSGQVQAEFSYAVTDRGTDDWGDCVFMGSSTGAYKISLSIGFTGD